LESLQIENTGKIQGDIVTPSLVIKQGAGFNGKCEMGKQVEEGEAETDDQEEEIEEILETEEVTEES